MNEHLNDVDGGICKKNLNRCNSSGRIKKIGSHISVTNGIKNLFPSTISVSFNAIRFWQTLK